MRVSACITTRNRTECLKPCLEALWNSDIKPHSVVVSDDSPDEKVQQQNQQVVQQYPGTIYVLGPQNGVCGNRNNAVNTIPVDETDLIAFVDDDICVEPDFITKAIDRYTQISPEQRNQTILSGVSQGPEGGHLMVSGKLTFRGYFTASNIHETVAIHAALFPRSFFELEQWDENIFFGYEDAELCLRALKRGYKILHCPELKVIDLGAISKGSLVVPEIGTLTKYEISVEAARLYVGIKRYKDLFPNPVKLVTFLVIYFVHMTTYLIRRKAIQAWPEIVRRSRFEKLWQPL
jgi:GT2 family glycosyltransferase